MITPALPRNISTCQEFIGHPGHPWIAQSAKVTTVHVVEGTPNTVRMSKELLSTLNVHNDPRMVLRIRARDRAMVKGGLCLVSRLLP